MLSELSPSLARVVLHRFSDRILTIPPVDFCDKQQNSSSKFLFAVIWNIPGAASRNKNMPLSGRKLIERKAVETPSKTWRTGRTHENATTKNVQLGTRKKVTEDGWTSACVAARARQRPKRGDSLEGCSLVNGNLCCWSLRTLPLQPKEFDNEHRESIALNFLITATISLT